MTEDKLNTGTCSMDMRVDYNPNQWKVPNSGIFRPPMEEINLSSRFPTEKGFYKDLHNAIQKGITTMAVSITTIAKALDLSEKRCGYLLNRVENLSVKQIAKILNILGSDLSINVKKRG